MPALEAMARDGDELGEPVRFVPAPAGAEVESHAYHGGVVFERTADCPARFLRPGERRRRHGGRGRARAVDRTQAGDGAGHGDRPRRRGRRRGGGSCTNAYADDTVHRSRQVLPVGSFIITEVLDDELARSVAPAGGCWSTARTSSSTGG